MRATASIVSALAVSVSFVSTAASSLRSGERALQNNYYEQQQYNNQWYYQRQQWGNNQGGGQQANGNYMDDQGRSYENFEEYMRAQMGARTFSFTGCSTVDTGYGERPFVTYRLCDSCSSRSSGGCDNSNGDYVVSMNEFAETYVEYLEQSTGVESSPFECVRAEEYIQNYYGNNNRALQNYYNNGQQQQNEFFIGPKCTGGKTIELGVFTNEWCSAPANGVSVKSVLGFSPDHSSLSLQSCISCTMAYSNYNNNNNGGEAELNPLCERMLERSGRCDRTDQTSQFDQFWEDVIAFVNDGGSTNINQNDGYGDYYEEAADYDQYQEYEQAQYNGGNRRSLAQMNYNAYANQNTCDFIDGLAHSSGSWDRLKRNAADKGISTGALIVAICAAVVFTVVVSIIMFGWISERSSKAFGKYGHPEESETPYQMDNSTEETKPEVTIS